MTTTKRRLGVRTVIASALTLVVVAAMVAGILLLDSPATERLRRLDERRVADLSEVSFAIDRYWTREGVLPETLDVLALERDLAEILTDPETGVAYEYRIIDSGRYELCAAFSDRTAEQYSTPANDPWYHESGRHCYRLIPRNIEKEPSR